MRIIQESWNEKDSQGEEIAVQPDERIHLVLAFGSRDSISASANFAKLSTRFPNAELLLASSAGEIHGQQVLDDSYSITAIEFNNTPIRSATVRITDFADRTEAGENLARSLWADDLALVFVLSDGQNVNGSDLVLGLNRVFEGRVPVVGGLAGDGANFDKTVVGLNALPQPDMIAAIGFYGSALQVGFGSEGGWEAFGPERRVTRAEGNVLYELDGKSALALYKSYLGDRAADLPSSGLLFPLSIRATENAVPTVRTILNIDEAAGSLTFAGDVPKGAIVRLMKASFDRLISGASEAAAACLVQEQAKPELAILISCVGRKLLLNQRVEEEVEEVAQVLGNAVICGFYSYGELSPASAGGSCSLHNQTMTVTTLREI